jgi:predicted transcriptional regulator
MGKPVNRPKNKAGFAGNDVRANLDQTEDDAGGYASYLEHSEAERALLEARIAEADKGIFISSEAMHRWMESWGTENELPPPEPDVFLPPRRA